MRRAVHCGFRSDTVACRAYGEVMKRYGQYCPVAKAAEVLGERWMLLVLRELLCGNDQFGSIQQGVGRISSSVLSARLRDLVRVGLVARTGEGRDVRYVPTEAGWELMPIVEAVGRWGQRWMHTLTTDDLDPTLLVMDISRDRTQAVLPDRRAVVHVEFRDAPPGRRRWWLVVGPEGIDACDTDPGFGVAVTVHTDVRTMTEVWMGLRGWADAVRAHTIELDGPTPARRAAAAWLGMSRFADVTRHPSALPRP